MLGGDLRQLAVAQRLAERYDNINVWGLSTAAPRTSSKFLEVQDMSEAIDGADVIVLPLPASVDGVTLNCDKYAHGISFVLFSAFVSYIKERLCHVAPSIF